MSPTAQTTPSPQPGLHETHTQFLAFLRKKKRANATILAYGKDIDQLIVFLQEKKINQPNDITLDHLQDFMKKLAEENYTAKSISRKTNSVKTYFRFLHQENYIAEDPAQELQHPEFESKPPRILSKLEYRALRDSCRGDIRIATIVELLLQTGIRIGELAALTMDDVRFSAGNGQGGKLIIRPFEGHLGRTVPLNRVAEQALRAYLETRPKTKDKTLFITKTGRPLLIRNIRTAIDRCFKLAGIEDAKVNDLRHTWIAYHLANGVALNLVSNLAGHKRITTTERYLEFLTDKSTESKLQLEEL